MESPANPTLDPFVANIFVREILTQAQQVTLSVDGMNEQLAGFPEVFDADRFWYAANGALNAMANIGNVLWPQQDRKAKGAIRPAVSSKHRGSILRNLLGIADSSVLALHEVRNGFTHFDERIDTWAATSQRRILRDRCVGEPHLFGATSPKQFARHFDPVTMTISVFGVTLDFQAAVDEVDSLREMLEARSGS